MVRTEFDLSHLVLNDSLQPTCRSEFVLSFKQYRQLLINVQVYVCCKLSVLSPVIVENEIVHNYAKILAITYFRLPEVGHMISDCFFSCENTVTYRLTDYEEKRESFQNITMEEESKISKLALPTDKPMDDTTDDLSFSSPRAREPEDPTIKEVPWVTKQQLTTKSESIPLETLTSISSEESVESSEEKSSVEEEPSSQATIIDLFLQQNII